MEGKRLTKKDWKKKEALDKASFGHLVNHFEKEIQNMPEPTVEAELAYAKFLREDKTPDVEVDEAFKYLADNPESINNDFGQDHMDEIEEADELDEQAFSRNDSESDYSQNDFFRKERKNPFPEWMMSYQFLDHVRSKVPVSIVVSRLVALKRQREGKREYYGLSPFKHEKTPSFFVNDQKGKWFDFSSGQAGDIFDFVMKTRGISFVGSIIHILKNEIGYTIPRIGESMEGYLKRQKQIKRRKNRQNK